MKFEKTEVFNFEGALRGMRNPLESWHKSDSYYDWENAKPNTFPSFIIGENDMQLAQRLIRAGGEHRKFMRQIFICVDVTAPLYWFKEMDTYKIGTVANSTSTMHKITSKEITKEMFEIDDYNGDLEVSDGFTVSNYVSLFIGSFLEKLREKYLKTKDKRYWKELIRWCPDGWLQTRTVTMNYENVFNMIHQRNSHKLNEWSGKDDQSKCNFIAWAKSLPYANELLFLEKEEQN